MAVTVEDKMKRWRDRQDTKRKALGLPDPRDERIASRDKRIAELEAALKPFAAIGAQIRWLDGSGYTTARLRVDDIVAAQKALNK